MTKHPSPSIDPIDYPSTEDWEIFHEEIERRRQADMEAAIQAIECGDIDHNFHINVTSIYR